MTLGVAQPPASTAPVMETALMLAETTSVRVTGIQAIAHPVDSPYALQTVHGGCTCHQPVEYISYGRACPENASRTGRYGLHQYHTYVPSPPSGNHVEDLPCPAAHEPGRQPKLVLCQCDGKQCDFNLWLLAWENLNSSWLHPPRSLWNQCTHHQPQLPAK